MVVAMTRGGELGVEVIEEGEGACLRFFSATEEGWGGRGESGVVEEDARELAASVATNSYDAGPWRRGRGGSLCNGLFCRDDGC